MGRVEAWAVEVGVPCIACVALSGSSKYPGQYRKPSTGMWSWLEETAGQGGGSSGSLVVVL